MGIEYKKLTDWLRERANIHNETLDLLEKNNEDFGKEWLEGKVAGLREVYFHLIECYKE